MSKFVKSSILTLAFIVISQWVFAQSETFDVYIRGKKSGEVHVNKLCTSGYCHYAITGNSSYYFVTHFDVEFLVSASYNNKGLLVQSSTQHSVNGKVRSTSYTEEAGKDYRITINEQTKLIKEQDITYSTVSLYFQEPKEVEKVYSERFGQFLTIVPKEDQEGVYVLSLPNDKESTYHYKEGRLIKVDIDEGVAASSLRRRS